MFRHSSKDGLQDFGVPEIVTTNRGSQFESEIFQSFTRFWALRVYESPAIILIQTEWRLFSQNKAYFYSFCISSTAQKSCTESSTCVPASIHTKSKAFLYKDFSTATHVFFRRDIVRRLLEQPYDDPYKVLSRTDKVFTLEIRCQQRTVTVDRLKPTYILCNTDHTVEVAPSPVVPQNVIRCRGLFWYPRLGWELGWSSAR
ncbi:hypothetical protein AVEN_6082-1 [Araneus ventricosus]|uniref:Integrase catalytic domain-containing protein n=1 Tax=Araneus ventricosus TaxID=182803 RepID=A0A4Y2GUC7_ARAVE|nr:hypothetical protein AVEN_6082-1 [Araneus ventricosus]